MFTMVVLVVYFPNLFEGYFSFIWICNIIVFIFNIVGDDQEDIGEQEEDKEVLSDIR